MTVDFSRPKTFCIKRPMTFCFCPGFYMFTRMRLRVYFLIKFFDVNILRQYLNRLELSFKKTKNILLFYRGKYAVNVVWLKTFDHGFYWYLLLLFAAKEYKILLRYFLLLFLWQNIKTKKFAYFHLNKMYRFIKCTK